MELLRQSRLSVAPVRDAEWARSRDWRNAGLNSGEWSMRQGTVDDGSDWRVAGLGVASPAAALAQGATVTSPVELARQAAALKPGQWVWAPQIAPAGPVLVYVDLSTQTADVYRNGVRIAATTVSTGKPGHETPTGVFHDPAKGPQPPFEQI